MSAPYTTAIRAGSVVDGRYEIVRRIGETGNVEELLGLAERPSAVFAINNMTALGEREVRSWDVAAPGQDTAVRSAVLLANDLAMLTLRPRLTEVLGFDPLSTDGMKRWAAEVFTIYSDGLGSADKPAEDVRG